MRYKHKEWKNGKGSNWTCRIIQYNEAGRFNIRLQVEDESRKLNLYPHNENDAIKIWDRFKDEAKNSHFIAQEIANWFHGGMY